uniref:Fibrinogen-like protein A n=1 Tax=Stichopus japonicus TaxID=307972 RepID=I6TB83_STIJA|nr:fibrinogen-like protein A [Apostichopus japonicus]
MFSFIMKAAILLILVGCISFCISSEPSNESENTFERKERSLADPAGRQKRQSGLSCPKVISHSPEYPRDCYDILQSCSGQSPASGQYYIQPDGGNVIKVYCDMETDEGGWTVFQRRIDGTINFYRSWPQYQTGFGNLNTEFWLGNDNIHYLTSQGDYELRVEMNNTLGNHYYAKYSKFRIGDSFSEYLLVLGAYSGTAGDSLADHNTMRFSTYDNDNDAYSGNCASHSSHGRGAWWYKSCVYSNLNGQYYGYSGRPSIYWSHLPGDTDQIPFAEMKLRPRST